MSTRPSLVPDVVPIVEAFEEEARRREDFQQQWHESVSLKFSEARRKRLAEYARVLPGSFGRVHELFGLRNEPFASSADGSPRAATSTPAAGLPSAQPTPRPASAATHRAPPTPPSTARPTSAAPRIGSRAARSCCTPADAAPTLSPSPPRSKPGAGAGKLLWQAVAHHEQHEAAFTRRLARIQAATLASERSMDRRGAENDLAAKRVRHRMAAAAQQARDTARQQRRAEDQRAASKLQARIDRTQAAEVRRTWLREAAEAMADEQAAAESLPDLTAPAAIVRHVLSAHGDHEPSDDEVEAVLGTARSLVDALRLGDDADGGDSEAPPLIVREVLAARWAACHRRQSASPGCTGTPPTIALFHGTRAELVPAIISQGLRVPDGVAVKHSTALSARHGTGTIFATLNFHRARCEPAPSAPPPPFISLADRTSLACRRV